MQKSTEADPERPRGRDVRNLKDLLAQGIETLGLIGSCVSRDLKLVAFGDAEAKYVWRVNTISLMSAAPYELKIDLPEDAARDSWLTLQTDVNKTFDLVEILSEPIVLLDFFRDVYGIHQLEDGRFITNGIEIQQYGLSAINSSSSRHLEAHNPEYIDLWLSSFKAFARLANAANCSILICPIFQLPYMSLGGQMTLRSDWDLNQIASRNIILGHMLRIATATLKNSILVPIRPEYLRLDPDHEYGSGPFHFTRDVYELSTKELKNGFDFNKRSDLFEETSANIVNNEIELWRKFNNSFCP